MTVHIFLFLKNRLSVYLKIKVHEQKTTDLKLKRSDATKISYKLMEITNSVLEVLLYKVRKQEKLLRLTYNFVIIK